MVYEGTPAFQAPECCGTSKMAFRGQPVDVWAAGNCIVCHLRSTNGVSVPGVCLYMFSFGRIPFVGANLVIPSLMCFLDYLVDILRVLL